MTYAIFLVLSAAGCGLVGYATGRAVRALDLAELRTKVRILADELDEADEDAEAMCDIASRLREAARPEGPDATA